MLNSKSSSHISWTLWIVLGPVWSFYNTPFKPGGEMLTLTLASVIFSTSCYLHKWLTLNIKTTRQFRENQRKAGRQLCMTFFRTCFIVLIVRIVNRFVDKTVVTAILVMCNVDQRCSSLSVSHKQMCYFTVLRHIFYFLTCKIIF